MEWTNEERIEAVKQILNGAVPGWYEEGSDDENIIDLLADIRHFCASEGLDYEALNGVAGIHFNEEHEGR